MDNVLFLVFGNHPKAGSIKSRARRILRFLKKNSDEAGGWVELDKIEKMLRMDRNKNPSMFYKPLSALKEWRLVDNKRRKTGRKSYTTYYKFTPERFLDYIRDVLHAKCETELKMFG